MREIWKKLHWIATFLRKRLLPKKSLARTSSSKTKWSAQARRIFRIPAQNQGKQHGTHFVRPMRWLVFLTKVRLWCVERDSNPRSPKATRLQRVVFDHSTIDALIQNTIKSYFLHLFCIKSYVKFVIF